MVEAARAHFDRVMGDAAYSSRASGSMTTVMGGTTMVKGSKATGGMTMATGGTTTARGQQAA